MRHGREKPGAGGGISAIYEATILAQAARKATLKASGGIAADKRVFEGRYVIV